MKSAGKSIDMMPSVMQSCGDVQEALRFLKYIQKLSVAATLAVSVL
jgi:hypothetical protein